jgi:hypothetical protein
MLVELAWRLVELVSPSAEPRSMSVEPGSMSAKPGSMSAEPELELAVGRTPRARKQKASGIKSERSSVSPLRIELLRDGQAARAAGKQNLNLSIVGLFSVRYSSTQQKTSQSK